MSETCDDRAKGHEQRGRVQSCRTHDKRLLVKALRLCLAAVFAAGCADQGESGYGPESGDGLATTVDTVGTSVRVANTGDPPTWNLAPVASIGPDATSAEATPRDFGSVTSVAFGPDEQVVYVADRLNCEISVFGLDGTHLRTFGRCGEGPGEFTEHLYSIAWVGDKLLTYDFAGGRIGEFTGDGEWRGQRQVAGIGTGSPSFALYQTGPDEAYARTLGTDPETGSFTYAFHGHAAAGATADTVRPLVSAWESGSGASLRCAGERGTAIFVDFFANPYAPRVLEHPGPGGTFYTAVSNEYRVVVTRQSDTLRTIERALPPEPVSDEEWNALLQQFEAWLEERPGASCEPPRLSRPSSKPFMTGLFLDAQGRMWVGAERKGQRHWDLFDPDGRLLARLPARDRKTGPLPAFGARHLATIRQDSLGLDHVDIWRIEPPARQ